MASDFIPFFAPLAGVALTAFCCAVGSWCSARSVRAQTESFHQRLLALEQAPAKVIVPSSANHLSTEGVAARNVAFLAVHGPSPPVYYQPPPVTVVASPPSQPKPSAPPSYHSYYPPYSSAYQGQQHPVVR